MRRRLLLLALAAGITAACGSEDDAATGAADGPPVRDDVPAALENASMSMASMTLNGQQLGGLSCTGEFNLFGGNPAGVLADQGPALSACVGGSAASPRVHYAFSGGVVSDVRVADAPNAVAARCIAGIVAALEPPGAGACVVTVVLAAR